MQPIIRHLVPHAVPHVVPHLGNSDVFCPPVKGLVLAERFVVSIRFGGDTDRAVPHRSGNFMVGQIIPFEKLADDAAAEECRVVAAQSLSLRA